MTPVSWFAWPFPAMSFFVPEIIGPLFESAFGKANKNMFCWRWQGLPLLIFSRSAGGLWELANMMLVCLGKIFWLCWILPHQNTNWTHDSHRVSQSQRVKHTSQWKINQMLSRFVKYCSIQSRSRWCKINFKNPQQHSEEWKQKIWTWHIQGWKGQMNSMLLITAKFLPKPEAQRGSWKVAVY